MKLAPNVTSDAGAAKRRSATTYAPVRRRRLYEEVEERLQEEIRSGRLKTGDAMPSERQLMRHFGVGRPAIRDAILALQRKGLLRVGAGERTRVSRPTALGIVEGVSGAVGVLLSQPEGVRDLQHVRRFFECAIARHVAAEATRADVALLAARLAENRAALTDARTFERTDVAFHYELTRIARNPIFCALHQATVGWLTEQRTVSLMQPGAMRAAYRAHEMVYQAIAAHDADAAEARMHAHLRAVERYYWRTASGAPASA
jgi:DNA-binding FadR family transcriptional regulator